MDDILQARSIEDKSPVDPEVNLVRSLAVTIKQESQSLLDCWNKFSSWTHLCRIVAPGLIYKRRLLDKVRAKTNPRDDQSTHVFNVDTLLSAEEEIIKVSLKRRLPRGDYHFG